ncbi:MAG: hypothetical protein ACERKO_03445 [Acetanaerobacterium sp.]
MQFSWIGLWIAAAILLPNLLFVFFAPRNVPKGLRDLHPAFTVLENGGRAAVFAILILFAGGGFASPDVWLALMCLCIAVYYALWLRYLRGKREFTCLFSPLWFIPVPMAVFPVLAFAFAAAWGRSLPLGIAVAVFGVGHLAISYDTYLKVK